METPLRIFIVDDVPFYCNLYRKFLNNLGHQDIHLFASSAECLDNLTLNPDLILLDHCIPPVNGLDTLKKIKRVDPNALVVFISGQENITVAVDALKYGALDYLVKGQASQERL